MVNKTEEFKPQTALGKRLWALRQQRIAEGGQLLTAEELEAELRERRGGVRD